MFEEGIKSSFVTVTSREVATAILEERIYIYLEKSLSTGTFPDKKLS